MIRTFVVFRWQPAAEATAVALADAVVRGLRAAGFTVDDHTDRDDHLREVWVRERDVWVEMLLGRVEEIEREWLVTCYPRSTSIWRLFSERTETLLERSRRSMEALDTTLRSIPGVSTVRWYGREVFEANQMDRWHDRPA